MIRINLQMFGGGGSGDDSIGAGHNTSQGTTKQKVSSSHGRGGSGGKGSAGGGQKSSSGDRVSPTQSGIISANEKYDIYRIRDGRERLMNDNVQGKDVVRNILGSKFTYDSKTDTYKDKYGRIYRVKTSKKR